MTITLDTPVTDFPGVGPARAKKLEKLGILRDLNGGTKCLIEKASMR